MTIYFSIKQNVLYALNILTVAWREYNSHSACSSFSQQQMEANYWSVHLVFTADLKEVFIYSFTGSDCDMRL